MLRSLMQVSGFTAISRVLGFVRDILIARYLGSGLLGDAFFSAFRFPNLFRRIFGEGAFNAAFVPMFGRRLEKEGEEDAMKFASNAFSTLLVVLIALTLVAIPCMHWIMGAVVPGFKAKVEMPLAVSADTPERENFSMAIGGSRAICLTIDGAGGTAQQQLAKLRLVKELPKRFSNILGDGPRGDSVSLRDYQSGLSNASAGDALKQVNPMEGITIGKGDYTFIQDGSRAWIYLPKRHDFGWFEGELIRTASAEGVGGDHQFKIYRNHPDTFDLTVRLSQITFCYLLFMALVAHLSGVLNTFKIFGVPAAAPILLNIVFLAGLGIFVAWQQSEVPAHVLAWCVAIAGVLQFSMLYGTCWKNGYHVRLQKPVFDSSIKRLFLLMGPGVLAVAFSKLTC